MSLQIGKKNQFFSPLNYRPGYRQNSSNRRNQVDRSGVLQDNRVVSKRRGCSKVFTRDLREIKPGFDGNKQKIGNYSNSTNTYGETLHESIVRHCQALVL